MLMRTGLEVPSAYAQIMSADSIGEAFHRYVSVGSATIRQISACAPPKDRKRLVLCR